MDDDREERLHTFSKAFSKLEMKSENLLVAGLAQRANRVFDRLTEQVGNLDLHAILEQVDRLDLSLTVLVQVLLNDTKEEDWAQGQEAEDESRVGKDELVNGESGEEGHWRLRVVSFGLK